MIALINRLSEDTPEHLYLQRTEIAATTASITDILCLRNGILYSIRLVVPVPIHKMMSRSLSKGVDAKIGEYQIYQSCIFSPDGCFDACVFSRGPKCVTDHRHHAQ